MSEVEEREERQQKQKEKEEQAEEARKAELEEGRVSEDFDESEHLVETHIGNTEPALAGVGGITTLNQSELPLPYMSPEEQTMEMKPQVVGPPGYASPDPATSAGRLLPVKDHPLNEERVAAMEAEIAESSRISEDYGKDVEDFTLPSPAQGGTQSMPLSPEQTGTAEENEGEEEEVTSESQSEQASSQEQQEQQQRPRRSSRSRSQQQSDESTEQ